MAMIFKSNDSFVNQLDPKAFTTAVVFFLAGFLSWLSQFIQYPPQTISNTTTSILVLYVLASIGVYFISKFDYSFLDKRSVEKALLACGVCLGDSFRLNVMRLKSSKDETKSRFLFVAQYKFSMKEVQECENNNINLGTPGIGKAYLEQTTVHLGPKQCDSTVDTYPNHVWNAPIPKTKCVLSIDTNILELESEEITRIEKAAGAVGTSLSHFHPGKLSFLR
ncbi:MAG: hypothetical protein O7G85_15475 [Planctomycetota bacterium]|nr:hypothetical protein [Planctomycetota bacterium]